MSATSISAAGPEAAGPGPNGATGQPRVTIATYREYAEAQRAVDHLSDQKFPVATTAIVGTNLRLVEDVTGRLTVPRAALYGAATGAWFGLLIGLIVGIFAVSGWLAVVIAGLLIGAGFGAVFGAIAQAMTGGRRDFRSSRSLQAEEYAVTVDASHAEQARQLLSSLPTG